MRDLLLTNARIVTADTVLEGTVVARDGLIESVETGATRAAGAIDLEGDYLLPGLVELHTDNLEKHFSPRPGVRWPAAAAVIAHDAQVAAAGITTVLDALALGDLVGTARRLDNIHAMVRAIRDARASQALRAEHLLHLRCEISFPECDEMFRTVADDPLVRLVSIMDHTPGQRQFTDIGQYRLYYQKKHGLSDAEFEVLVERQMAHQREHAERNRNAVIGMARELGLALASHDDATAAHVEEAVAGGMTIAEFPTTLDAARAARDHGLSVLVGGPNIVLGKSHSGNIAALELAKLGLVDVVSSDYVPASMIQAPFLLTARSSGLDLPAATRLVSRNPARAVGLNDRGEIAPGLRADLVRVSVIDDLPVVRTVWREGARVA